MFKPELLNTLKSYNSKTFVSDLIAGVIVGIVALPLAIAFAIASGVNPAAGLFTAIIAGFCISAFGGSRVQIGGPTGAFAVIVYGVVAQYGLSGLATATVMAGIILILLGAFKMGGLVKFIPYTIVTGFTAGIAVTIAAGQLGDFFGLRPDFSTPMMILGEEYSKMPGDFLPKIIVYIRSAATINWYSFAMAAISLAFIFIWSKFIKKIPGSFVVIILATVVSIILEKTAGLKTDTIGTFANGTQHFVIPNTLPKPQLPALSLKTITTLFPTAVSIAVLAAIESLLSAVVADGMIGSKHDSNTELIAQGIANIASPLFGGIPATGAIARTATNIKNGGKTPVAGIIHALTLLIINLCAAVGITFFGHIDFVAVTFTKLDNQIAVLVTLGNHCTSLVAAKVLHLHHHRVAALPCINIKNHCGFCRTQLNIFLKFVVENVGNGVKVDVLRRIVRALNVHLVGFSDIEPALVFSVVYW